MNSSKVGFYFGLFGALLIGCKSAGNRSQVKNNEQPKFSENSPDPKSVNREKVSGDYSSSSFSNKTFHGSAVSCEAVDYLLRIKGNDDKSMDCRLTAIFFEAKPTSGALTGGTFFLVKRHGTAEITKQGIYECFQDDSNCMFMWDANNRLDNESFRRLNGNFFMSIFPSNRTILVMLPESKPAASTSTRKECAGSGQFGVCKSDKEGYIANPRILGLNGAKPLCCNDGCWHSPEGGASCSEGSGGRTPPNMQKCIQPETGESFFFICSRTMEACDHQFVRGIVRSERGLFINGNLLKLKAANADFVAVNEENQVIGADKVDNVTGIPYIDVDCVASRLTRP